MVGMDAGTVVALVCGLVLGLALGALAGLLLTRARRAAEVARAREETARVRVDVAEIRAAAAAELAEARAEAAAAQAEAATVAAALAGAQAERDAAVNRAREIAGDREAMLNQFKVLSADTLDRHSKAADAQAEHRLKATEQLMVPVRESLDRFGARLTEVEKERSAPSRPSSGPRWRPCDRPARPCAGRPPPWSPPCASRRSAARGARPSSSGWPRSPACWTAATSTCSSAPGTTTGCCARTCGSTWPRASTCSSTPRPR